MTCESCGAALEIGDWPYCPHGRMSEYRPFVAYFDVGLGREITSQADRWTAQRQLNVQPRDSMSKGDLSARRDRLEAQKVAR